jgi:hypothetical protein
VVNAHFLGDPTLPVREEFAKYIHDIHRDGQATVALGDNNFERDEMILAYERMGFSEFSLHSKFYVERVENPCLGTIQPLMSCLEILDNAYPASLS